MLGPDPNKGLLKESTRLAAFLQECLTLGSLWGFRHFYAFVRGREELVFCVNSAIRKKTTFSLMPLPILETYYPQTTIKHLNAPELISPLDRDLSKQTERTVFLIAGYAKYRCPYVWLRSHHEKLIKQQPNQAIEDDNPLQLRKTLEWKTKDVALWEIVAEILSMTVHPSNPFEVDFDYLDRLPLEEGVLLTGSLLAFLESVWIQAEPDIDYIEQVYQDIQKLQSRHLEKVYDYSLKN